MNHPITDVFVAILIVASVALLVAEVALDLSADHSVVLVGDVITGVFAVELSLRYYVAKKKWRFFRRYWPDLLAILPLLRPVRFIRFLRLLRLFRLFQLGMLLDRRVTLLRGVLRVNFYFLWTLLVMTLLLVIGGGIIVYFFEAADGTPGRLDDLGGSVWWALYTVISGEPIGALPNTPHAKVLLAFLMLGGMSIFAVFTGTVSATMMERLRVMDRVSELDIEEIEHHIVICGWNASVPPLLAELVVDEDLRGLPIVLVNQNQVSPEPRELGVRADLLYHLHGDYTQLSVLTRAGVDRAARAVVVADNVHTQDSADRDARSVLAALTIERLNPDIYCVVELMNPDNEGHLGVAGVEAVIMRDHLSGRALASACRHPGLMRVMMNLLTVRTGETMHRIPGPKKPMAFGELQAKLKNLRGALMIGIERSLKTLINPGDDLQVEPTDWLIVIGGPLVDED